MSLEGKENGEEKYIDRSWSEWSVQYHWLGGKVIERCETQRGTVLEMVHRPKWGLACYMNGEIQSGEVDEKIYHEALVHPAMVYHSQPTRVLILGGGEGATAREVLKWPSVEKVDMYEWDAEVVDCFRNRYRHWADGAWEDPRLHIHYEDVFSVIQNGVYPPLPYDVIIVDLFEPVSDPRMWALFSRLASNWLSDEGAMSMYAGIRNHWRDIHPAEEWLHSTRIQEYQQQHIYINQVLAHRDVFSYKVFLPSFFGESMFLLLTSANQIPQWSMLSPLSPHPEQRVDKITSHLTSEVWVSYHTWNQYPFVEEREDVEGVLHEV